MPYNNNISRSNVGALIPEDVSREIIQTAPEQSAFLRLARRVADMPSRVRRMPVLDVLPTAYFVSGDTGLKQTTGISWANKYLYAEELAVIVPIPEAVLEDQAYDMWGEVKPRLVEAFGKVIDGATFFSTNKPTDWPDGIVTQAIAASNTIDFSTVQGGSAPNNDLYYALLGDGQLFAKVELDGFAVTGAVGALSMLGKLRGTRDTQGQPIFRTIRGDGARVGYELEGVPLDIPKNGAWDASTALMVAGDFSQAIYSIRQDITYKVLTEGVVTDASGAIIYNLPQQDMIALRCVMRLAWQLPNPINQINQVEATRSPFAVLVP